MSDYHHKNSVLFCLKIFFALLNSVDPDEMQHDAAFHLGLRCLRQKYSFRGNSNTKSLGLILCGKYCFMLRVCVL